MSRSIQEFDLFGDAIPTYDTKVYTPQWFAEMHALIDQGRRCREQAAWLKAQDKRWHTSAIEDLGNGMIRVTQWKD